MSALKPVGVNTFFATSTTSARSEAISQQTDTIRVVCEGVGAHVAIGTLPVSTVDNFYVGVQDATNVSLGPVASQRVVGITTGTSTIIDFPEGTGSPFGIGDAVTLTVDGGSQSYYDFSHKIVDSIDNTIGADGFHGTRITIGNDSSGIVTAFEAPYATLRKSLMFAAKSQASTGKVFIQQVQVS
jgi:hypothetical protein|tara:strand:- start:37 stop:591 length:555 start_codon:yes stop_codon:yes gene_type:complete